MLIPATDKMWSSIDDTWSSQLMTPALIEAAAVDPSLWREQADRIAKFPANAMIAAKNWASSQKLAFANRAPTLGLPASSVASIAASLGPLIFSPPANLQGLADVLIPSAIGVATDALAAIPIVGPIARAIGSFALFLAELAKRKPDEARDYLPPPREASRDEEDTVMNTQALLPLTTRDWTGLFLPRLGTTPAIEQNEKGWVLTSSSWNGNGLGFMPGSQAIHSGVQVYLNKKSKRAGGSVAIAQDTGDFYPGVAQLMTSIDQQVQQPGAPLWAVNIRAIRDAWHEHHAAYMAFAIDLWSGKGIKGTGLDKLTEEQRHLVVQQLVAPMFVGRLPDGRIARGVLGANTWTPKAAPQNVLEAFIDPWCDRVSARQRFFTKTIVVAYADPQSVALREWSLRKMFDRNRALLLQSPYRHAVNLTDVIDSDFRAELFASTVGGSLNGQAGSSSDDLAPPRKPKHLEHLAAIQLDGSTGAPEPPLEPQGGAPFEIEDTTLQPRGGTGVAVGLGLAALGFVGWRSLRRRRRG